MKHKKKILSKSGIGGFDELDLDQDLLSGLDEISTPQPKGVDKPIGKFVFGRSKTPELRTSRSLSRINSKCDETDASLNQDANLLLQSKKSPKVTQSSVFEGVLKEASKKIAKDSQEVNYVSKNKETIVDISKRNASKSVERPTAKPKQPEGGQTKQEGKKPAKKETKTEANKENNPPQKKLEPAPPVIEKKPSVSQLNKVSIQETSKPKPQKEKKNDASSVNPKKQDPLKNYQSSVSPKPKKETELVTYSSRIEQKNSYLDQQQPAQKSPLTKSNVQEKIEKPSEKSPSKGPREKSKPGSKKQYKPETMDLYMRLNEYTKFKENVEKLSQPDPQKVEVTPKATPSLLSKEKTEAFLKQQITNFKENQSPKKNLKRTPQKSIDLQKVSQPRHKKKAVEIPNECSFQPMLSKKSMEIVQKMV